MSVPVDREGNFRCQITDYGLKEMDSGAVSVAIKCRLIEWFGAFAQGDEPCWNDFSAYSMEAEGDIWIVSGKEKGNKVNESAAKSLMEYAGWDGMFDSIQDQSWVPTQCQVLVKQEEYKGVKRFKVAFLGDWNRAPGGQLSNVDAGKVKALSSRFGAQFRALAGNVKRADNGAATTGRPATPPPPSTQTQLAAAPSSDPDDIPFAWLAPFIGFIAMALSA